MGSGFGGNESYIDSHVGLSDLAANSQSIVAEEDASSTFSQGSDSAGQNVGSPAPAELPVVGAVAYTILSATTIMCSKCPHRAGEQHNLWWRRSNFWWWGGTRASPPPDPPLATGLLPPFVLCRQKYCVYRIAVVAAIGPRLRFCLSTDILRALQIVTSQCTLVQRAVLGSHVVRLSECPYVRLYVTLVICDHIGWKSWKLIAQTISPTYSLFVAKRRSTYSDGNIGIFWGD